MPVICIHTAWSFSWCALKNNAPQSFADLLVNRKTVHGQLPFARYEEAAEDLRRRRTEEDLLPAQKEEIPVRYYSFLQRCWEIEPFLRLPAHLAYEEVKKLASSADSLEA